jgi:hypothetical protein
MKLIYTATGKEVQKRDVVNLNEGGVEVAHVVTDIRKPHKPGSTGRVYIQAADEQYSHEFFPSVIGAEWTEREDQNCDRLGLCEDFPHAGKRVVLEDGFGSFVVQL